MSKPACDCLVSRVTILHEKTCASLRPAEPAATQDDSFQREVGKSTLAERPAPAAAHSDHPLRHYDRTCPACNSGEPTAAPDGRVTLSAEEIESIKVDYPQQPIQDLGNQALAAIDYKAEVERLRVTVAERGQLLGAAIIRLQELGETEFVFSNTNAEAALKPVSEAEIKEVALRYYKGSVDVSDHGLHIIENACREVLRLAGVEVKP